VDDVIDSIVDGVALVDATGKVIRMNAAHVRMFGFGPAPEYRRHISELAADWEVRDHEGRPVGLEERPVGRALRGEVVRDVESHARRLDGEQTWIVSQSAFPVTDENGIVTMAVVITRDLTDLRRAEAEAEETQARLSFLAEATRILAGSLDFETTLAQVARLTIPQFADWASLDVVEDDGSVRQLVVAHHDPGRVELARELRRRYPIDLDAPYGLANVLRTGLPELYPSIPQEMLDEATTRNPELREVIEDLGLTSALMVPLRARDQVLGALTLVYAESGRRYDQRDLELAESLGQRAGVAIDNSRLYRDRDHIAKTLQAALLPARLPTISGVEWAVRYVPFGEGHDVGGDFYDVFGTGEDTWAAMIGDVCGKGADAAAVMGIARFTVRALAQYERRPSAILAGLSQAILEQAPSDRFATACYARLTVRPGRVRVTLSLGGHPCPVVMRADGSVKAVGRPGTLLGLFPDPVLSDDVVDLQPGEAIVFYTDGIERHARESGEDILTRLLQRTTGLDAEGIAQRVMDEVMSEPVRIRGDDVALLVFRVLP